MKLCKDCVHFRPDYSYYWFLIFPVMWIFYLALKNDTRRFAKCARTSEDFITGKGDRKSMRFCSTERHWFGKCGVEGKYFEPRR